MAKEVKNPNMVPTAEEGGPEIPGGVMVDLPENVGVRVINGQPVRQIPTFNSKGKQTGWDTVLDKVTQFAQPKDSLDKTAHHATVKGTSRKVLVFAETGVLLARFADVDTATKHLLACGLSLEKLLKVTQKDRGRDIRQAVPAGEAAAK